MRFGLSTQNTENNARREYPIAGIRLTNKQLNVTRIFAVIITVTIFLNIWILWKVIIIGFSIIIGNSLIKFTKAQGDGNVNDKSQRTYFNLIQTIMRNTARGRVYKDKGNNN